MKVVRRIHRGFKEWEDAKKKGFKFRRLFGKYQYIFSSEKGDVSLVELPNYFTAGETLWEIYCLEGNLFEDVERFETKEEAEKRIAKLLN